MWSRKVYRLYDADGKLDDSGYVRHGLLGHELLAEEGFPETVCRFASCHTGVGLSREDLRRQGLPLPVADYLVRPSGPFRQIRAVCPGSRKHPHREPVSAAIASRASAGVTPPKRRDPGRPSNSRR